MNKLARSPLTPVKQGKLTELFVSQIKDLIFSKGIDVGQKLPPERELAERLNISRSAVRERLSSLEHAGFVEINKGWAAGAYIVDRLDKPLYDSTTDLLRSGKIEIRQFLEARMAVECRDHLITMMLQPLMRLREDMGFNSSEPAGPCEGVDGGRKGRNEVRRAISILRRKPWHDRRQTDIGTLR